MCAARDRISVCGATALCVACTLRRGDVVDAVELDMRDIPMRCPHGCERPKLFTEDQYFWRVAAATNDMILWEAAQPAGLSSSRHILGGMGRMFDAYVGLQFAHNDGLLPQLSTPSGRGTTKSNSELLRDSEARSPCIAHVQSASDATWFASHRYVASSRWVPQEEHVEVLPPISQ